MTVLGAAMVGANKLISGMAATLGKITQGTGARGTLGPP